MKDIKYVSIGFHNCDSGEVSKETLSVFDMWGISESISMHMNATAVIRRCRDAIIRIDFKKNYTIYTHFGELLLKRIQTADITSYHIFYNDGTEDNVYVQWGEGEWINELQTITLSDDNVVTIHHKN
jgi:hypothetical protein